MNIDDIARLAGVSKASVSRVINKKPNVSDKLRDKVLEVVKENNYKINPIAQALNTKRMGLIGVLIPTIGLDVFSDIVRGISQVLEQNDFEMLLINYSGDIDKAEQGINTLINKHVDGIIYFPGQTTKDHERFLDGIDHNLLLMGNLETKHRKLTFKDQELIEELVDELVLSGHKRIGFLNMPSQFLIGESRGKAYRASMIKHNLESYEVHASDISYEAGYHAGKEFDHSVIIACMDRLAIGLVRYFIDQGKEIPNDVSIIGIDDMEISSMTVPRLSTVKFDYINAGYKAAVMLLEESKLEEVIDYEIIHRSTTRR